MFNNSVYKEGFCLFCGLFTPHRPWLLELTVFFLASSIVSRSSVEGRGISLLLRVALLLTRKDLALSFLPLHK